MPRMINRVLQPASIADWQQNIVNRIRKGQLVPVISGRVINDWVLGGDDALIQAYTDYCPVPLNGHTLPDLLQFRSITDDTMKDTLTLKEDYINFIKNRLFDLAEADGVSKGVLEEVNAKFDQLRFSQFSAQLGYPRFGDEQNNPLLLLASFNLPIYITTSYHDFLEVALRKAGKRPYTEICRWHDELKSIPTTLDRHEPTPDQPVVYHLYGLDEYADSLVLTDDDFLHFLVAASRHAGSPTDPVHWRIREALTQFSPMLLGYSLYTWDLRALFWGLIVPRSRPLAGLATIQLEMSEIEKRYLQRYLDDYLFDVYLGDVQSLVKGLAQNLGLVGT